MRFLTGGALDSNSYRSWKTAERSLKTRGSCLCGFARCIMSPGQLPTDRRAFLLRCSKFGERGIFLLPRSQPLTCRREFTVLNMDSPSVDMEDIQMQGG